MMELGQSAIALAGRLRGRSMMHATAGSGPEAAIRCRGLAKTFDSGGTRVQALRGVDLEIMPGAITLLVVPSGCGKTTLISIIAGLLDPSVGSLHVLGRDLKGALAARACRFPRRQSGLCLSAV
jgi:putative ABC transport system ATP-binding protein